MTEPSELVQLPRPQAEALLDYLASRPFGEVSMACGWLMSALNAQPIEPEAPEEGDKD